MSSDASDPREMFAALVRAAGENQPQGRTEQLSPERSAILLRTIQEAYLEAIPFKVGDFVTPRAHTALRNPGLPHLVVEVNQDAPFKFDRSEPNDATSYLYGTRDQIRVLTIYGETVIGFWNEAWLFEPYVMPNEAKKRAN